MAFAAPEQGEVDRCEQIFRREWLVDEPGRVRFARALKQFLVDVGGHVDHGYVQARADLFRWLDTVHAVAELDVHQDQIGVQFGGFFDCFAAVFCDRHDRIAKPAKSLDNRPLIFDYEDLLACHLFTRRCEALSDA